MRRHQLKVRTMFRPDGVDWDDASLGSYLSDVVRRAMERGSAPPVALCIRDDRIDLFDLRQVGELAMTPQLFLASLSRVDMEGAGPVRAVGLVGVFLARERKQDAGVPMAMVFLEWADCRWWQWRVLIDPQSKVPREDTETWGRAVDGDARPAGLGGWWSLGRRARLQMKMEPTEPQIVH